MARVTLRRPRPARVALAAALVTLASLLLVLTAQAPALVALTT